MKQQLQKQMQRVPKYSQLELQSNKNIEQIYAYIISLKIEQYTFQQALLIQQRTYVLPQCNFKQFLDEIIQTQKLCIRYYFDPIPQHKRLRKKLFPAQQAQKKKKKRDLSLNQKQPGILSKFVAKIVPSSLVWLNPWHQQEKKYKEQQKQYEGEYKLDIEDEKQTLLQNQLQKEKQQ